MYKKIKANNYNIHFIKTDKYKTITIKINFKRPNVKEEITKRNVLVETLFSYTKKYSNKRLLDIEAENLYGLAYRGFVFSSGIYSILSLEETFLDEKYTENGMIKKSIDLLCEVIFNPNCKDNKFISDGFIKAYHNIEDELLSLKENTNLYSQIRLVELLDDPVISMRNMGYLEDLKKINESNLYDYYLDVLNNDIVDIFIIGNVNDKIIDYIKAKFNFNKRTDYDKEHIYNPFFYHNPENYYLEDINTSQSKLVMGFKLIDLTDFERRYVLSCYNYILGGSADSKLFKNVREKESLCYSISSTSYPLTGLFLIKAGINASNYDKTLSLVKKEVSDMNKGLFNDNDLDNAKLAYLSSLKELKDNPGGILSLYMSKHYVKADSYNNKIKNIKKVTKQDILVLAKKIKLDTVYLLKGINNEDN